MNHYDDNIEIMATLIADDRGGFVVQQMLADGHLRTYGGFASEQEARDCAGWDEEQGGHRE